MTGHQSVVALPIDERWFESIQQQAQVMAGIREILEKCLEMLSDIKEHKIVPATFTPEEAAVYLNVSVATLANGRMNGDLGKRMRTPGHLVFGEKTIRYEKSELDRWIRENAKRVGGGYVKEAK